MSVKSLATGNRSFSLLAGNTPEHHVLLAETTVGAGGTASVTFSNIDQSYQHLQIRMLVRTARAGQTLDAIKWYANSDTTDSNYNNHDLYGNGTSAGSAYNAGTNIFASFIGYCPATNATASIFGAIVFDLLDYTNTSKYKVSRSLNGYDLNGSGTVSLDSVLWRSTNAITSLQIAPIYGTGFVQYTTVQLYGVR